MLNYFKHSDNAMVRFWVCQCLNRLIPELLFIEKCHSKISS